MSNPLLALAKRVQTLEKRVRTLGSTSQLAYSSIEGGAISGFNKDGSQTLTIGRQWDGTYNSTAQNGPVPPTPTYPDVTDATESLVIRWDGLFVNGIVPMDFLRVDAHVGTTFDFLPSHSNRVGSIVAAAGGEITVGLPPGDYYVKLVCWSVAGIVSPASEVVAAESWPVVTSTDGFAPDIVEGLYSLAGIDFAILRWTAVTNPDPVMYEVHLSTSLGFTADTTTKIGETSGTQFTVRRLPGPDPEEGAEDPFTLEYGVTYYARIVARDADGAGPQSLQAPVSVFQVTGVNIAADSITAANILAGSLTGELFSAEVVLAGLFRAGDEDGQNVQFGTFGIYGYKANGDLMIRFPTNSEEEALFDGELVVRSATILGGMSIQSLGNEMTSDSQLTLQRGITTPTASPTFAITYESVRPSTTSLTPAQKTSNDPDWGLGGPFDLAASEVSWIEWKPAEQFWIFWQIRSNGTRAWFINEDGTPYDRFGTGVYFNDYKGWRIWSTVEITTSTAAKNGSYSLFQFIAGAGDWYLYHSNDVPPNNGFGFNRYTPINSSGVPAIGTNGTDLFVAERLANGQLRVGYHAMVSDNNGVGAVPFLPAASTVYTSNTGTYAASLCGIGYDANGFDVPYSTEGVSSRYYTAERGVAYSSRLIYQNGSGLWPGSTGATLGWGGTGLTAESWESPTSNRRGMAWDGTHFWTLGGDGVFYKHEDFSTQWNTALTASTWWGQVTFRDDDAAGTGTHETKPGTAKSFTMRRRAKLTFTPPDLSSLDTGDPDDPNKVGLYMGRLNGGTPPANGSMWLQAYTDTPLTITNLVTSGSNPPTTNTFPSANPAKIRNDDETLMIDATARVRARTFEQNSATAGNIPFWGTFGVTKTADQTYAANSATLQNDTHLLFTAEPNAKYSCQLMLIVTQNAAATAADLRVAPEVPSGSWTGGAAGPDSSVGTTYSGSGNWQAIFGSGSTPMVYGLNGNPGALTFIPIWFIAEIGATGGTVRLRFAQNVATVGITPIVKSKSLLLVTRYA